MFNPVKSLGVAGIFATALIALGTPALATTYNWCPTASSGAIVCNNCTVKLTCNLNGFGITIRGRYVTLDGQGYYIQGYNPSNPLPSINDLGTGTTIKNISVYYAATGISVNQGGWAHGAKTIQNVNVHAAGVTGIEIVGINISGQLPYPQTTYVRDSWTISNYFGVSQTAGDKVTAPLAQYERIKSWYNRSSGFTSGRATVDISGSDLSDNTGPGFVAVGLHYGRIHGNTATRNNQGGFNLYSNEDTYINANWGHSNNNKLDCYSNYGAQGGVWNDFGLASGPGCTN